LSHRAIEPLKPNCPVIGGFNPIGKWLNRSMIQ